MYNNNDNDDDDNNNDNKRNALICSPLISQVRELSLQVRAGSFLEQSLAIEPLPF